MNEDLRVGLIGFGLGGAVFHAPLIAATRGLLLKAVVTSDPERARQVELRYPDVTVFDNVRRLWAHREDFDLVVVASPNRTHVPLARAALAAGLHVVVDKPMAATADDGRSLLEEARRRGLLLTPFHNRRWDGDFMTVRGLLARGELGRVQRFESRFERWRPQPKAGWRQSGEPGEAGGLLYDLGSHLIDQALVLFGSARSVYAELEPFYEGSETDNDSFVSLTHEGGVRSHLWMSIAAAQAGPRFRVLGSEAAYTKFGMDVQEEALQLGGRPGESGWGEEVESRWGLLGAGEDLRPVPTEPGSYHRFYEGVVAAIREGAPPPVEAADAVAMLEVIEAARLSHAEGQTVKLK
ncbi:MAG: scyllo-inositol 2-dehydrogenase [Acidobacteriota bacterium]|nr:scyllo-inositol 2-dehydrogenase [Acidobacteriota bacterium]